MIYEDETVLAAKLNLQWLHQPQRFGRERNLPGRIYRQIRQNVVFHELLFHQLLRQEFVGHCVLNIYLADHA